MDNAPSRRQWQDYGLVKDKVVKILTEHPEGMTGAKVAGLVGITQGAMSKYLSMLKVDGVITSLEVGVAKLWKLVSQVDRAGMLADRIGGRVEDGATFRDYTTSLAEHNGCLFEADGGRVVMVPAAILPSLYRHTKEWAGETRVRALFYEQGRGYAIEAGRFVGDLASRTGADFMQSFFVLWRLRG
ncbi:MAG: hypothetical protein C4292_01825 [Nitrososphaera sp.]